MKQVLRRFLAGAVVFCMAMTPFTMHTFAAEETVETTESAVQINLASPDAASTSYTVDTSDENGATLLTITAGGTYELSGTASNLSVIVAKKVNATLILNNAVIDNSGYTNADPGEDDAVIEAGIVCKKNSNVSIVLKGSSKILCNSADSYMENGVKHAKNDGGELSFSGSGALTISGTADDAVKYKGGTVSVSSGTLTIEDCYGDGIQAELIDISGGTLNITLAAENANVQYYTSGSSSVSGKNTIWESGTNTKYERVNVDTGSHKALKGGTKAKTYSYTAVDEADADTYTAGTAYTQDASGGIVISGGTINIDTTATGLKANRTSGSYTATSSGVYIIGSPDDGIHSNNTLSITGGTIHVAASDDGITAASDLTITGTPVIEISTAYEGIEGGCITIGEAGAQDGPDITIYSNDDSINAASKTVTYTYDSSADEDANYTKKSVSNSDNSLTVYSGNVKVYIDSETAKSVTLDGTTIGYTASGDGLDCNGSLDLEGGTVYVFGQTSGDNSPIDTDNGFTLSDAATVLAVGCDSMGETAPSAGNGVYLTYTGSETTATAVKAGSAGNAGGMMAGGNAGGFSGEMPGGNAGGFSGEMPGGNAGGFAGGAAPGGMGSAASISAGTLFQVSNGTNTLISETLPYAASYVLYASPKLTAGTSYSFCAAESGSTGSGSTGTNTEVTAPEETGMSTGTESTDTSGSTTTVTKTTKAKNTLTVKVASKTYKRAKLTKKKTFNIGVKKARGKVTYTLSKAAKKAGIKVNSKGKVTIPKNCKKGTYKITVKAAGNSKYKAGKKVVTIKVK